MNDLSPTLLAANGESGNNKVNVCYGVDMYNQTTTGDITMSMTAKSSDPHHVPCVIEPIPTSWDGAEVSPTLTANNAGGESANAR